MCVCVCVYWTQAYKLRYLPMLMAMAGNTTMKMKIVAIMTLTNGNITRGLVRLEVAHIYVYHWLQPNTAISTMVKVAVECIVHILCIKVSALHDRSVSSTLVYQ